MSLWLATADEIRRSAHPGAPYHLLSTDYALRRRMTCKKCGKPIPAGSKFCAACGEPVIVSRELVTPQRPKKKTAIWAILAGIVAVIIAILLLMRLNGTKVIEPTAGPSIAQSPVLNAPATPQPPASDQPPPEIVAYINHVKAIEAKRVNMRLDLSPAFQMLGKAYGLRGDTEDESREEKSQGISSGLDEYAQKWQELVESFNSVQPPSGCQQLAGAYGTALGKYSKIMIEIETALSKQDISALMAMQGTAQADVDASLVESDQAVDTVCKTYGIRKDFRITPDKGVDSLLLPAQ